MIDDRILFGKYRICKPLGSGRSGTVFLTYHRDLEEYRAVKVVPKTMADYETFRKEALFLKTLRHPGIPLVYDVEEDTNHSYLIEEYLEGESLYALVKRLGSLSAKTAADFGIQLCRIIHFMNTAETPVLYLDLQPKNLLICGGHVKLIDFDHAQYVTEMETSGERYGTVGFAAPEQYLGEPLDLRTDVYAIGALLYFMCVGRPPGREPEFGDAAASPGLCRIIRGCMARAKEDRYSDAADVEAALTEWNNQTKYDQAGESLKIVFAGAKAGCGTTHAALGLTNFLARNGRPTLYQEGYDTDTVRMAARNLHARPDEAGVYHIGCTDIRPYYGSSVRLPYPYYPNIITDMGASWLGDCRLPEADLYVLVCGGKWWETDHALRAVRGLRHAGRLAVLWNHMPGGVQQMLPEDLREVHSQRLPYFANPFQADQAAGSCYRELFEFGTGGNEAWKSGTDTKRRRFFRRRGRG